MFEIFSQQKSWLFLSNAWSFFFGRLRLKSSRFAFDINKFHHALGSEVWSTTSTKIFFISGLKASFHKRLVFLLGFLVKNGEVGTWLQNQWNLAMYVFCWRFVADCSCSCTWVPWQSVWGGDALVVSMYLSCYLVFLGVLVLLVFS